MLLHRTIGILLAIASMSYAQSFKIEVASEIQMQGVTLLPADSPEAVFPLSKIAGSDLQKINNLLPFSVVLINNGSNRLLGTVVCFRWVDSSGEPHKNFFAIQDFGGYPSQIKPGDGRLFVLQRGLNIYFSRRAAKPDKADPKELEAYSKIVTTTEATLRSARTISVSIDSIVVEGVGLVGPDLAKMRGRGWDRTLTIPGAQ